MTFVSSFPLFFQRRKFVPYKFLCALVNVEKLIPYIEAGIAEKVFFNLHLFY